MYALGFRVSRESGNEIRGNKRFYADYVGVTKTDQLGIRE